MAAKDLNRIAERYTRALFALASEQSALDAVEKDLSALQALFSSSDDLRRFVANPLLPRARKALALDALLAKGGAHGLTRKFTRALALGQRLDALSAVTAQFEQMLMAHRGETLAEVTTAEPVSDATLREIVSALSKSLDKKLKARASVDPSLIGGLTVKVGGMLIDHSLRNKLAALSRALKKAA